MKSNSGFWLCQSRVHGIEANWIPKKMLKTSLNQSAIQNGHSLCNWLLPHWNQADHDAHKLNCFPQFSSTSSCERKKRERPVFFFLFCFSFIHSPFSTIILVQRSVMIIDVVRLAHCLSFELLILINHHHHYPGEPLLRSNSLGTFLLFIGHMLFFVSSLFQSLSMLTILLYRHLWIGCETGNAVLLATSSFKCSKKDQHKNRRNISLYDDRK